MPKAGAALPSPAPAPRHLLLPRSRLSRPLRGVDSCPTRSALISILALLPRSKRKLSWLSTPGDREREPFSSLTSVKPSAGASLAAPAAALGAPGPAGPTPGRRPSPRRGAPAPIPTGAPPGLPRTQTAQAGRKFAGEGRPHRGPGIPGCSASPRNRAEGAGRLGPPEPDGDALPAPTQPCRLPKGK